MTAVSKSIALARFRPAALPTCVPVAEPTMPEMAPLALTSKTATELAAPGPGRAAEPAVIEVTINLEPSAENPRSAGRLSRSTVEPGIGLRIPSSFMKKPVIFPSSLGSPRGVLGSPRANPSRSILLTNNRPLLYARLLGPTPPLAIVVIRVSEKSSSILNDVTVSLPALTVTKNCSFCTAIIESAEIKGSSPSPPSNSVEPAPPVEKSPM